MERKYTANYFKESLPEWKRKKDSLIVRYFFRPISFHVASFAANRGIEANDVSFFSMAVAIIGSALFVIGKDWTYILGAVMITFWMVLDCTDGNIARSVRKEHFGEFADGASSYILINILFAALGIAAYKTTGLIFQEGNWLILFLGVFSGSCDSLARLLYQKFENNKRVECENKEEVQNQDSRKSGYVVKLHDRIDKELGLNGIFLPAIVVCSVLKWFDIFILFYAVFYIASLLGTIVLLVYRVRKANF